MSETNGYGLPKPEEDDFYDVREFNRAMDRIDEVLGEMEERKAAKDGDISEATVGSLEAVETEFPVPGEGEKVGGFLGKVRKFMEDFNSFKAGVITLGKLANNGATTEAGFALDARYGKVLYDMCRQNDHVTEVTLTADSWIGNEAPYVQTVAIANARADLEAIVVSALEDGVSEAIQKTYSKAFGIVTGGTAVIGEGYATFKVYKKPANDITIGLKGV